MSLSSDTIDASTGTSRSRPCLGSPRAITRRATGISSAAIIPAKACRQSGVGRGAEGQRPACSRIVQASRKTPALAPLRVRLCSNAKCGKNLGQRDKPSGQGLGPDREKVAGELLPVERQNSHTVGIV